MEGSTSIGINLEMRHSGSIESPMVVVHKCSKSALYNISNAINKWKINWLQVIKQSNICKK